MTGKSSTPKTNVFSNFRLKPSHLLFALILLLGFFARTWEFGSLPPGLNQDEALIGGKLSNWFIMVLIGMAYRIRYISFRGGVGGMR